MACIDPLAIEFVGDRQQIRRRHGDEVRLEIDDELNLPLGKSAADRNDRAAKIFGAVVNAEPAGEQSVAIGNMHLIAGPPAGGADRARH